MQNVIMSKKLWFILFENSDSKVLEKPSDFNILGYVMLWINV